MKSKFLSFMGILRKSGKISLGSGPVKDDLKKGKTKLIMMACDFSEKSCGEIQSEANKYNVSMRRIKYSMNDINNAVGKYAGVIGIGDSGCACRLAELIDAENKKEDDLW